MTYFTYFTHGQQDLPCPLRSMAYQMDSTYPMEADSRKNEENFKHKGLPEISQG